MISSEPPILLGVCASIAAYKSVTVARELQKAGRTVQVVMSPRAQQFVGPATFAALTGKPPYIDLFQSAASELHVELTSGAEQYVIAPATADCLARLAQGRADDPVSATALCFSGQLYVAPAMHPRMWEQPATQANCKLLRERGAIVLGPSEGVVASGDYGMGRLLEPELIANQLLTSRDLEGLRLVITAGPTVEDLDAVRFISNRSSGKMGFALARQAARRGASVQLIAGPVEQPTPHGVVRHNVRSALEMQRALQDLYDQGTDGVVMVAAVGDFRPKQIHAQKLKRSGPMTLELVENPDLIAGLGQRRQGRTPILVAFAVETGTDAEVIAYAQGKLTQKHVDLVVANHASDAFGHDDNRVHLVDAQGSSSLERQSKQQVADQILSWVKTRWVEQS